MVKSEKSTKIAAVQRLRDTSILLPCIQALLRFLVRDRKAFREDLTKNTKRFLGFPMTPCDSPKFRVQKEAPEYEAGNLHVNAPSWYF